MDMFNCIGGLGICGVEAYNLTDEGDVSDKEFLL